MIIKKGEIGNVECTIIRFGKGSVQMVGSITDGGNGFPCLLLKSNSEDREVGEVRKHNYKNSDDLEPEIAIIFENEAGMDAFISSIDECREYFKTKTEEVPQ